MHIYAYIIKLKMLKGKFKPTLTGEKENSNLIPWGWGIGKFIKINVGRVA